MNSKRSVPLCVDCIFYKLISDFHSCGRRQRISPVTGKLEIAYTGCNSQRNYVSLRRCGPRGKFFIAKAKGKDNEA